jgi:hypothetical protein
MIASVSITLDLLTANTDILFALGPIAHLRIETSTGPSWDGGAVRRFAPALGSRVGFTAVSVVGPPPGPVTPDPDRFAPFSSVPVLDLRALGAHVRPADLLSRARRGAISPVVLYRATRLITERRDRMGRVHQVNEAHDAPHVIDPHGRWSELRPRYEDLLGEVIAPFPYQGTTR